MGAILSLFRAFMLGGDFNGTLRSVFWGAKFGLFSVHLGKGEEPSAPPLTFPPPYVKCVWFKGIGKPLLMLLGIKDVKKKVYLCNTVCYSQTNVCCIAFLCHVEGSLLGKKNPIPIVFLWAT